VSTTPLGKEIWELGAENQLEREREREGFSSRDDLQEGFCFMEETTEVSPNCGEESAERKRGSEMRGFLVIPVKRDGATERWCERGFF
jgi:hypothetical protein